MSQGISDLPEPPADEAESSGMRAQHLQGLQRVTASEVPRRQMQPRRLPGRPCVHRRQGPDGGSDGEASTREASTERLGHARQCFSEVRPLICRAGLTQPAVDYHFQML